MKYVWQCLGYAFTISSVVFVIAAFTGQLDQKDENKPVPDRTEVNFTQPESCIVNGFGNELCGNAARAYCEELKYQSYSSRNERLHVEQVCEDVK